MRGSWRILGLLAAICSVAGFAQYTPPGGTQSGGMVLLEQHTASTSAELDFTAWYSNSYDEYVIELVNLLVATNATSIIWQASTNGGSSYDAGSNYSWSRLAWNQSGGASNGGSASDTSVSVGFALSNSSSYGLCSSIRLSNPGSSSVFKILVGQGQTFDGTNPLTISWGGTYKSATAVNAFRFLAASGNLASGTVRVYGLAK